MRRLYGESPGLTSTVLDPERPAPLPRTPSPIAHARFTTINLSRDTNALSSFGHSLTKESDAASLSINDIFYEQIHVESNRQARDDFANLADGGAVARRPGGLVSVDGTLRPFSRLQWTAQL